MKTSTAAMASGELSPVALAWVSWPRRIAEQRALWKHFGRHWYVYLPLLFVYLWALDHIGVNWTPSLPYHVVYIEKHVSVGRGDLVVFRFEGGEIANHFKGQRFFKRIAGVAGRRDHAAGSKHLHQRRACRLRAQQDAGRHDA